MDNDIYFKYHLLGTYVISVWSHQKPLISYNITERSFIEILGIYIDYSEYTFKTIIQVRCKHS